jgi:hypothetical protein
VNKALRALEQAGAGLLAEDPAWAATLEYLAGPASRRGDDPRPAREELVGEVFVGADGLVCADRANAAVAARPIVLRRFLAPSDSRMWRLLALLRRGIPASELQAVTGIAPWFLAEMERRVDLAARIPEARPAASKKGRLPRGAASARERGARGPDRAGPRGPG